MDWTGPMIQAPAGAVQLPRPLESYPSGADQTLAGELAMRSRIEPFNLIATGVFLLAILHTFATARILRFARELQRRREALPELQVASISSDPHNPRP